VTVRRFNAIHLVEATAILTAVAVDVLK